MTIYLTKTTTSLPDKAFKYYDKAKEYLEYCKNKVGGMLIYGIDQINTKLTDLSEYWRYCDNNGEIIAEGEIEHLEYDDEECKDLENKE